MSLTKSGWLAIGMWVLLAIVAYAAYAATAQLLIFQEQGALSRNMTVVLAVRSAVLGVAVLGMAYWLLSFFRFRRWHADELRAALGLCVIAALLDWSASEMVSMFHVLPWLQFIQIAVAGGLWATAEASRSTTD